MEDSRLGLELGIPELLNPIAPMGKTQSVELFKKFLGDLDGMEPKKQSSSNECSQFLEPYFLVISETKRIAETDDDFNSSVWEPYLKEERKYINKIRKFPDYQFVVLSPDGTLRLSGTNEKL